ncbi:MAG: methyltransferase domain-containing protein [Gemmatimonadaceae bacterium]|nr:methyltransferase domain-containing protein [Gemmatimonadaceae bacterium]
MSCAEELTADLERRFRVVTETIRVGAGFFKVLRPDSADDLISEEDFVGDERLPYWAAIWPSSIVIANELAAAALNVARGPKRTIELGCGIGVVTTAAMKAGLDVLATDYYEPALEFTRANTCRNIGREAATRMVNWRDLPADLGRFDLILASDVLYEREYAGLLPRVFDKLLQFDGHAVIADPGRVSTPAFLYACKGAGFKVVEMKSVPWEDGAIKQKIDIYTIAH